MFSYVRRHQVKLLLKSKHCVTFEIYMSLAVSGQVIILVLWEQGSLVIAVSTDAVWYSAIAFAGDHNAVEDRIHDHHHHQVHDDVVAKQWWDEVHVLHVVPVPFCVLFFTCLI